jgi:HSP20 family protein
MSITRWDPFGDLLPMQDDWNQFFNRLMGRAREGQSGTRMWSPALDIAERDDAYVVTAEIPGLRPEDIQVTLEDGALSISGERKQEKESGDERFHRVERSYGAFRRMITLPSQVRSDGVEASYDNGVLKVVVPKAEGATPKKITVRPGSTA